jgi:hypothetical protein
MKTTRLYQLIILVLVILNLGTLAFIWFGARPRENAARPGAAAELLIRELGLTDSQQQQYQLLRQQHRNTMARLSAVDRSLHNRFFDLLMIEPADTTRADLAADSIAANRKVMEMVTYDHFYKVMLMLTPGQKEKFRSILHEVIRLVLPPPPPRPGSQDGRGRQRFR